MAALTQASELLQHEVQQGGESHVAQRLFVVLHERIELAQGLGDDNQVELLQAALEALDL